MNVCNACGGPKPDDNFRACPDCRAEWRAAKRDPNSAKERLERLQRAARAVLDTPSVQPYRLISPYRELAEALEQTR